MQGSAAKKPSFLMPLTAFVLLGLFLAVTQATGQTASWTQLFQPQCTGTGGCKGDCLNHATTGNCNQCGQNCFNCGSTCTGVCPNPNICDSCDPTYCQCAQGNSGNWFHLNVPNVLPGNVAPPNIQISAAAANVAYCQTVNTQGTCQFSVGSGGVTQISFNFAVSAACSQAAGSGTLPNGAAGVEWLAFWIDNQNTVNTAEVDFIESRFGPSGGLNSNFDGQGSQKKIFDTAGLWSGYIKATFSSNASGCSGVEATVQSFNAQGGNLLATASSCLSQSSGYYFLMDTAGGSKNPACTITVSNLQVQGLPPSSTNCVGLAGASS